MTAAKPVPSVFIQYVRIGASIKSNELGVDEWRVAQSKVKAVTQFLASDDRVLVSPMRPSALTRNSDSFIWKSMDCWSLEAPKRRSRFLHSEGRGLRGSFFYVLS